MKFREIEKILYSLGFRLLRSRGNHYIFSNGIKTFPVPNNNGKDVNRMLTRRILKEAGYINWRIL